MGELDSFDRMADSTIFANFPVTLGEYEDDRVDPPCKGGVDDFDANPIEDGNGSGEDNAGVKAGTGDASLE